MWSTIYKHRDPVSRNPINQHQTPRAQFRLAVLKTEGKLLIQFEDYRTGKIYRKILTDQILKEYDRNGRIHSHEQLCKVVSVPKNKQISYQLRGMNKVITCNQNGLPYELVIFDPTDINKRVDIKILYNFYSIEDCLSIYDPILSLDYIRDLSWVEMYDFRQSFLVKSYNMLRNDQMDTIIDQEQRIQFLQQRMDQEVRRTKLLEQKIVQNSKKQIKQVRQQLLKCVINIEYQLPQIIHHEEQRYYEIVQDNIFKWREGINKQPILFDLPIMPGQQFSCRFEIQTINPQNSEFLHIPMSVGMNIDDHKIIKLTHFTQISYGQQNSNLDNSEFDSQKAIFYQNDHIDLIKTRDQVFIWRVCGKQVARKKYKEEYQQMKPFIQFHGDNPPAIRWISSYKTIV